MSLSQLSRQLSFQTCRGSRYSYVNVFPASKAFLTTASTNRPTTKVEYRDPEDRLKHLRKGERIVAVFAGISLLVGYLALKKAFSSMASSHHCPRPLVVAGPSGSGKSTLIKQLFEEFPEEFGFSVSHTSRKPRPKEKHGKEYYFSSREVMQASIDKGEFIETAEYSGNLYGTSKRSVREVQSTGKVCVLDIDMQGVRSLKSTELNPIYIFIQPPSIPELEKRLRARKTETEESLKKRLDMAVEEMDYAKTPGVFDHIIINETVEVAYNDLKQVVLKEIEAIRKHREQ